MTQPATTVPDLLRERAADDPEVVALAVDGGQSLSYDVWDRRSNAFARGLAAHEVGRGDRIVLLFDNARWTEYAVAYLGVHKAGAVAVPVGTRFTGPELAVVVGHCRASGVVSPPELAPEGAAAWTASPEELEAGQSQEPFQVGIDASDLAEVLYSSGTTGAAKGVACSHANVLFHDPPPGEEVGANAAAGLRGPNAAAGRATLVHAFPVGTNAAQEVLRVPLRRGDRTVVSMSAFEPERFCALVAEHGVKRLQLVPTMAQVLVASGAPLRHDLSSVERVVLSSAPTPAALLPRLAAAFPRAELWNTYALTEGGTARTLLVDAAGRPGSVGRAVGGTEVRVVDDEEREVPAGCTGEVWLRRPGAPRREYYRDPESTAATWAGEWLRTGDLGYVDDEGYLYLVDRKKDLIITGGLNVSSLEVEEVLHQHPAVVEAAVFGVPHGVLGQDVAAAVVLRSPLTPGELQAFARTRLAEHKTPHRVVVVDDLPRNPSGKVLKRELRDRFADVATLAPASSVAPRTPAELAIASIWAEVLGRDRIGVDDDFFDLGGHSLAAAQILARVNDAFSVDLPLTIVFDAATVSGLAAAVEAALEGADGRR